MELAQRAGRNGPGLSCVRRYRSPVAAAAEMVTGHPPALRRVLSPAYVRRSAARRDLRESGR
ncbi:hypothetical protein GCM10023323_67880 [Streptomyces thinghirensis]|uniref:Uncharacterized protein n=1 Tax=Streptomyces thinghirensis TaxID=551547 RepID=A0ABP9TGD0_9ACTN